MTNSPFSDLLKFQETQREGWMADDEPKLISSTTKYVAECIIDGQWSRSTVESNYEDQIEKYAKECFSNLGYRIIKVETKEFVE